jgi:putative inorganic carbon (hco3(-)) transporter
MWSVCEIVRMVKTFLLYWYLIHNIRDMKEVRWLLFIIAVGLFLQFAVCVAQKYVFKGSMGMKYLGEAADRGKKGVESMVGGKVVFRAGGLMGHPNHFAYYLDLLIPLMLSFSFLRTHSEKWRLFYLAAAGAGLMSLYFTLSRSGMLATGVCMSACFFLILLRNVRRRVFLIRTFAIVLAGLAGCGFFASKILERFTQKDSGALSTRFYQYQVAGNMAMQNLLLGVGVNNYPNVAIRYDETAKQISKSFKAPVHNIYLLALTETGLVGLAALIIFALSVLLGDPGLHDPRRRRHQPDGQLHVPFFSAGGPHRGPAFGNKIFGRSGARLTC